MIFRSRRLTLNYLTRALEPKVGLWTHMLIGFVSERKDVSGCRAAMQMAVRLTVDMKRVVAEQRLA